MTTTTTTPGPSVPPALELLAALPLEDGTRWGERAHDWQLDDARAILDGSPSAPRRHFLLRGRGMSKTTDLAGVTLALLLTDAPAHSTSLVYASDEDQAQLLMEALTGFVHRAGLLGQLHLAARSVTNTATGAELRVETSDGASALGKRPWLQVVDELAAWPSTLNHRTLWSAIVSAVPKVPGSRLVVITTAGSPSGIGADVWAEAEGSRHWRTARNPGPAPWWSVEDIEATRASLTAAEWSRLIECVWAEADDALTTAEDIAAAIRPGDAVLPPRPGVEYVAALDVGTRRDLTALVVGHAERRQTGRVVVIDRVLYWRPQDTGGRVDLAEVEAAVLRVCREYGARLRFDRMQAEQLTANLERAGVRTAEFVFSSAGANRLARRLWGVLRDRALSLPDETEVREEFLAVRMIETGPGTVKLSNPRGTHDDIPTAVGMVVADLLERDTTGVGRISVPQGTIGRRGGDHPLARPSAPMAVQLRNTQRANPRVPLAGLFAPGDGSRFMQR